MVITAGVVAVVVVAVWLGGGWLWHMLLAMHGHH
jgi:hypothetical protein